MRYRWTVKIEFGEDEKLLQKAMWQSVYCHTKRERLPELTSTDKKTNTKLPKISPNQIQTTPFSSSTRSSFSRSDLQLNSSQQESFGICFKHGKSAMLHSRWRE